VLKGTEELSVLLEDQGLNLQSMMASPYVKPFLQEVRGWEQRLSTIGECSAMWMVVQRKWMYLESIFVGSDDIRWVGAAGAGGGGGGGRGEGPAAPPLADSSCGPCHCSTCPAAASAGKGLVSHACSPGRVTVAVSVQAAAAGRGQAL
jgi:hypothetical protein